MTRAIFVKGGATTELHGSCVVTDESGVTHTFDLQTLGKQVVPLDTGAIIMEGDIPQIRISIDITLGHVKESK